MYTLFKQHEGALEYLELKHSSGQTKARICLSQGGRLDQLEVNGVSILANFQPSSYDKNYASAILFPFPNRIKNGSYVFQNKAYQLQCNEDGRENALHGLVYNKTFELVGSSLTSEFAELTLRYNETNPSEGFPFPYCIDLTYTLSDFGMRLKISVLNTGKYSFPYALGWHPYFRSKDLYHSSITFNSDTHYIVDDNLIIKDKKAFLEEMPFQLKDKFLDDGFELKDGNIAFKTPEYDMAITTSNKYNYLQLYTPSEPNCIAIEPMTAPADSFNNHIGLQTLAPQERSTVTWELQIETKTLNSH